MNNGSRPIPGSLGRVVIPEGAMMENYCSWCHQTNDPLLLLQERLVQVSHNSFACPQCNRTIILISVRKASEIAGVSRKTIYQWIDKGLISTVRNASGRLLICFSSLFSSSSNKADENSGKGMSQ